MEFTCKMALGALPSKELLQSKIQLEKSSIFAKKNPRINSVQVALLSWYSIQECGIPLFLTILKLKNEMEWMFMVFIFHLRIELLPAADGRENKLWSSSMPKLLFPLLLRMIYHTTHFV